jgi:hypothetical protein
VEASVDGDEERLFIREDGSAGGASGEVCSQFALRLGASGGGFD